MIDRDPTNLVGAPAQRSSSVDRGCKGHVQSGSGGVECGGALVGVSDELVCLTRKRLAAYRQLGFTNPTHLPATPPSRSDDAF